MRQIGSDNSLYLCISLYVYFILGPEWAPYRSDGRADRDKLNRIPLRVQWD